MTDAEEEPEVIVGELYVLGVGVREQGLELGEGLARDQDALFAADAVEVFVGLFYEGQAMSVGGDHGDGFCFKDQEGAVQGVAGFFVRDREDGAADKGFEDGGWDLDAGGNWQLGDIWVISAA